MRDSLHYTVEALRRYYPSAWEKMDSYLALALLLWLTHSGMVRLGSAVTARTMCEEDVQEAAYLLEKALGKVDLLDLLRRFEKDEKAKPKRKRQ
jgi:hypothetical protein